MKNHKIVVVTAFLILLTSGVSAQLIDLVNVNFGSSCAAPPAGWRIEDIDGSCTWRCSDGGITQNNHTSQGCANAANDWLITPALPLDNYRNEVLNYTTTTQYSGGGLAVKYSTNYPGTGNPNLYTWGTLIANVSAGASGNINLSGISGDAVYIAFQYTSTGNATNQAARWTITSVTVRGEEDIEIGNLAHRNITSSSAILGAEVINAGTLTITERGMLWSTAANPTLSTPNTTKLTRMGSLGVYDTIATGLPAGTLIYYRGYTKTATKEFYSPVSSFYTLSDEPLQHATAFNATSIGSNAIVLKWNTEPSASGYLILQRTGSAPTALPQDAEAYTVGHSFFNDAKVASVLQSGSTATDTIKNLLSGTRYYFTLIPFGVNAGNIAATYNYFTTPVIPVAHDSTFGAPTALVSDIIGLTGTESNGISSVENTAAITANTEGVQVWKLAFRDGGNAMNDADELPTIFNEFTLTAGTFNSADWQSMIQSVALFDDSTGNRIGTATVSANSIRFTALNIIASDNNYRTASIRLSLNKNVALPENTAFQFALRDSSVKTQSAIFSSQVGGFVVQSDALKNKISVAATRLRIVAQPPTLVEAGVPINGISAELTDVWNNVDADTALQISVKSVLGNIQNNAQTVMNAGGRTVFNNIVFKTATGADTLIFEAGDLTPVKSAGIKVRNSLSSDIVATPGFIYERNIPYINYQDSAGLSVANTFPVFSITLRDGGFLMNDADSAATVLTALHFSVTHYNQIRALALFDSSETSLGEVIVNASAVDFTNLHIKANDNGQHKLLLRATFKKVVNDGTQLQFKITQAASNNDTLSSQFIRTDAGGASSSTAPYENKIDVAATKLEVVQQPALMAYVNEAIQPAIKVLAVDSFGNTDRNGRIINATVTDGGLSTASVLQVAVSPANGYAEFSTIAYNDTVSDTKLHFTDGLLSVETESFQVTHAVWYRSAKSGNWDSVSTWQYSEDNGQTWNDNPVVPPDAAIHGQIKISAGHTVTMQGGATETVKIDETVVEENAVLITPVLAGKKLEVMNGKEEDLLVYGTLKHTNGTVSGIVSQPGSVVTVMPGGTIELAANGYAADWAANPNIQFKSNAVYYHNTTQTNAITPVAYFVSAAASDIPVFRLGVNYTLNSSATDILFIKGIVQIDPVKTLTLSGSGKHIFRNGFFGNGNIIFNAQSDNEINGIARLSGGGSLHLNDNARLRFTSASEVALESNKTIHTNNNRWLNIGGKLNTGNYTISGNANIKLENGSWLLTAHNQGVKAAIAVSGNLDLNNGASIEFTGAVQQQLVELPFGCQLANLKISNLYGVVLTDLLHVSNSIDLARGSITTSGNGVLSFTAHTAILHHNINRFINGKARVAVDETVFLPIGKQSQYAPVTIINRSKDSSVYEVEYSDTHTTAVTLSGSLVRVLNSDSWTITRLHGNTDAKVVLSHHASLQSGENLNDLRVVSYANGTYTSAGPNSRNATQSNIETNFLIPSGVFAIAIDQPCNAPSMPVVANDTVCYGNLATLVASGANNYKWYASADDDRNLASGNSFVTAPLFADTAFYVETQELSCISNRAKLVVKVVEQLQTPVIASTQVQSCKNVPLPLTAAGTNMIWFSDAQLSAKAGEGQTFVSDNLDKDTAFYVASSKYGCLSHAQKINVLIKAVPAKPLTVDITTCKGNTAVLSASSNATHINWYATLAQTTPLATGSSVSIKNILADTAIYVEAVEGQCPSERVKVNVKMAEIPDVPVITTTGFACAGSSVTLHASGTDTIRWYVSDADTSPVRTGNTYTTQPLSRNTLFFVNATNGLCSSATLAFPVTVAQTPMVSEIRLPRMVKQYDSVAVAAENNRADEYNWIFGNDAEPASAVGAGPHYVKWKTPGMHRVQLAVSNTSGIFACTKEIDTVISVTSSTGVHEVEKFISSLVYPNPASSFININVQLKNTTKVNLYLTDALGKTIWKETSGSAIQTYSTQVDVSGFGAGVYVLCMEAEGSRKTQKVMINK